MKREMKIFLYLALPVALVTYINKRSWDSLSFIDGSSVFGGIILFMTGNIFGLIIFFLITYFLVRLVMMIFNKQAKE